MPSKTTVKSRCFLALPFAEKYQEVRRAVKDAVEGAGLEAVSLDDQPARAESIERVLFAELARADYVVADVSAGNANVFFEIGQAFAMAKGMVLLANKDTVPGLPFDVRNLNVLEYQATTKGMVELRTSLKKILSDLRHGARRSSGFLQSGGSLPFVVDWDRLDVEDVENLCRELIVQMGFRQVDWNKGSKEFDLIAELPKKDPDGFEYSELWLISLGRNEPVEMILDRAIYDPEYLLHHILRDDRIERRRQSGIGDEVLVTMLFVATRDRTSARDLQKFSERFSRRSRDRKFPFQFRIRIWDHDYLSALIQQFPQLGYKYFSDEARSLAKFRKGPEELYRENVQLTERLAKTISDLESERNLRVRAERDAVWKDISFSAAHKIGNPIFAIETDLAPLRKRIVESRTREAIEVTDNMQSAVEKAKGIVEQFKSLTKAQQVTPVPMHIRPALEEVCQTVQNHGAHCELVCDTNITVLADPERLQEVFDELAANAVHWFDKPERELRLEVELPARATLPLSVDSSRDYALIHFKDNGAGVTIEIKERIFEAFFTTYDQGTGLGLALVRRIVEGHQGMIREVGLPGRGADFEVFLPLAGEPKLPKSKRKPKP